MADRIVIMRDGVVEQMGAPLDLYDRPASLFVAGFIGSPAMNLLSGRIGNGEFVSAGGLCLPLRGAGSATASPGIPAAGGDARSCPAPGASVVYGIRPEDLQLCDDGIPFEVAVIEPTGAETQIVARHHGEEVTFTVRERALPQRGDVVRLRVDAARSHLFDAASGRALRG